MVGLYTVIQEISSFAMSVANNFCDTPLPKYLDSKTVLIYRPHPVCATQREERLLERQERSLKILNVNRLILLSGIIVVSHQWCDLFHRLLHSYTRHEERVARGERDTVLSA